jgi:hypothetical protein
VRRNDVQADDLGHRVSRFDNMITYVRRPTGAVLALAAFAVAACGGMEDPGPGTPDEPQPVTEQLYEAPGITLWPDGQVPICFNGRAASREAGWLRDGLRHSWAAVARLDFQYSDSCPFPGRTEYVQIDWVATNDWRKLGGTCGLGTGRPNVCKIAWCDSTMSMADCDPNENGETFTQVAVHEVGHALGWAHEHQRPDVMNAPAGCLREPVRADFPPGDKGDKDFADAHKAWETNIKEIPNGTKITPYYDPDSIMNYCRGRSSTQPTPLPYQTGYRGADRLSAGDQYGAGLRYRFRTPYWMLPTMRML